MVSPFGKWEVYKKNVHNIKILLLYIIDLYVEIIAIIKRL